MVETRINSFIIYVSIACLQYVVLSHKHASPPAGFSLAVFIVENDKWFAAKLPILVVGRSVVMRPCSISIFCGVWT
jgi:hypothetical protein